MAIANELSSDIAVALMKAKEKHPGQMDDLKEVLLKVHSTLQQLTAQSRHDRRFSKASGENKKCD